MIDEKIDLTLDSIFAGDSNSWLLSQNVRQNREKYGLDHSRATVRLIDAGALDIVDNIDGKRLKQNYNGKIQLEALGCNINLDNSIIWDGDVQAYASAVDNKMYFVNCDRCGKKKEFNCDPLCEDCKDEMEYEYKHQLESMRL